MELNGGSIVAMTGKNCVAIASDLRLGNQALTIATNFEKVRLPPFDVRLVVYPVPSPCLSRYFPSQTGYILGYLV